MTDIRCSTLKYAVKVTNEKRTWYCKVDGKISTMTKETSEIPTDEKAVFTFDEIKKYNLLDSSRVAI